MNFTKNNSFQEVEDFVNTKIASLKDQVESMRVVRVLKNDNKTDNGTPKGAK